MPYRVGFPGERSTIWCKSKNDKKLARKEKLQWIEKLYIAEKLDFSVLKAI